MWKIWRTKNLSYEETREYVIRTIRDFLDGTGGAGDWDDFISCPSLTRDYPDLEAVYQFCITSRSEYPPTDKHSWCGPDGLRELRCRLNQLEGDQPRQR